MTAGTHWTTATVRRLEDVVDDVRLIEFVPDDGAQRYDPGSHLDVAVTVADLPDVRSYSLVGEGPADGAYRIAVKLLAGSRGGSEFMWRLREGERLAISHPLSDFELHYGSPEYLLIAGGIGITPMVGIAYAILRQGTPFRLLYAGRERDGMPFLAQLEQRLGERLECHVSRESGRIDVEAEIDQLHPEGEIYVCGPLPLMDAVRHAWKAADRSPPALRFETFASGGRFAPEPFVVRVRDYDGREVEVAENRTMLDALRDAGVEVMYDCLRGECGLCVADVLDVEGELDHRDVFLSDDQQEESRKICTCVSRAVGGAVTVDTGFRAA